MSEFEVSPVTKETRMIGRLSTRMATAHPHGEGRLADGPGRKGKPRQRNEAGMGTQDESPPL
ncbi:MAG TPA: hypothetical protein VK152_05955 [Paludibacter sp.]|nr:hypothetical protein [Paludibacter sp.]